MLPLYYLSPPGYSNSHGPPNGPSDPAGSAGCLIKTWRGRLRRARGERSAPLPGHVRSTADQRNASAGED